MDQELAANLEEFSRHIQGVGRMIGSKKPTLEKLSSMQTCLEEGAKTLNLYVELIKTNPDLL